MAIEKIINIKVNKKDADSSVKELDKNIKTTEQSTQGLNNSLDKMSGGAVSAFGAFKSGLMSVVKGFKSLRVAIIATGIGALIVGILAVKTAFTNTEEGQNKFAKLMGIIGSVTGNFIDLIAGLGEKIISIFENPKQAIIDLKNLIVENITNRISSLIETFGFLGSTIKKLFARDFTGAIEEAKKAGNSYIDTMTGVKNTIDKVTSSVKDFSDEIIKEGKIAAQIADQRAKADKIERSLIVERAEANKKIADLRFKSEQRDKFSAAERIAFLKEASTISEDITNKEIAANKLRLEAQIEENKLSGSNKADLDAVAQLKAKEIQLDTAKLNLQKRLQTSLTTFQNEEKSANKPSLKGNKKSQEEEDETKRLENIAEIQDEFKKKREDELAQSEIKKLELEKNRKLKELEDLKASEQQKADVITFYNNKINNQTVKNEKTANHKKKKDAKKLEKAKIAFAQKGLSLISALAGKGSDIGKGVAVAQATISGIEGVQNAYSTAQKSPITLLNPAYPIIQAGIAGAFSALQIEKILSTNNSSSGASGASDNSSVPAPSAPSFNLVQGTDSNQIAQSLQNNNNQPVEAFVVGSSVTTQQELDNNKIEIGSI